MLREGAGGARDEKLAFQLCQGAASRHHPLALNSLGLMYETGLGCAIDLQSARNVWQAAAKLGSTDAVENLLRTVK